MCNTKNDTFNYALIYEMGQMNYHKIIHGCAANIAKLYLKGGWILSRYLFDFIWPRERCFENIKRPHFVYESFLETLVKT
jgi:hypothetical protein